MGFNLGTFFVLYLKHDNIMENMQLIRFVSRRIRGMQSLSLSLSLVPFVFAA